VLVVCGLNRNSLNFVPIMGSVESASAAADLGRLERCRQGLIGVPAEQEEESPHGIVDSATIRSREQIEQEARHGGDRQCRRDPVDGGQGLVEPVTNRMIEEIRVPLGVTKCKPVRFEEEPQKRSLVGVGHPRPHGWKAGAMTLCFGTPRERSQSITHSTEELLDELLFRTEVVEKDWCLRSERSCQRPKRQVGNAVGDDVVDGAVEKFLTAPSIGRSGHHPDGTRQAGRDGSG